jgi:hypothetical protein
MYLIFDDEIFERLKDEKEKFEKERKDGKRVKWETFIFIRCMKK